MSIEGGNIDADKMLTARLTELEGRLTVDNVKMDSYLDDLSKKSPDLLTKEIMELITKTISMTEYGVAAICDYFWVKALVDAHVETNTILEVWETKDKVSSESN